MNATAATHQLRAQAAAGLRPGAAAALTGLPPRLCRRLLAAGHDLPLQAGADLGRVRARVGPSALRSRPPGLRPAMVVAAAGLALIGALVDGLGLGAGWASMLGGAAAATTLLIDAAHLGNARAAQRARQALIDAEPLAPAAAAVERQLLAIAAQVYQADLPSLAEDDALLAIEALLDAAAQPDAPLHSLNAAGAQLRDALAPAHTDADTAARDALALAARLRAP